MPAGLPVLTLCSWCSQAPRSPAGLGLALGCSPPPPRDSWDQKGRNVASIHLLPLALHKAQREGSEPILQMRKWKCKGRKGLEGHSGTAWWHTSFGNCSAPISPMGSRCPVRMCQVHSRCSVNKNVHPSLSWPRETCEGSLPGSHGQQAAKVRVAWAGSPAPNSPVRTPTLKKSSWWITQQLGSTFRRLLVSVVLPPLVMLWGHRTHEAAWLALGGGGSSQNRTQIQTWNCKASELRGPPICCLPPLGGGSLSREKGRRDESKQALTQPWLALGRLGSGARRPIQPHCKLRRRGLELIFTGEETGIQA